MLRVEQIDGCEFPIVERTANSFRTLVMPGKLLQLFNDESCHAVRITSADVAAMLPDYGGGTAAGRSQTPHQDHAPNDPRRFLAFSKTDWTPRGSATYLVHPDTVRRNLPSLIEWFTSQRSFLRDSFVYRPPYMVSQQVLYRCFEKGGLDAVVTSMLGQDASEEMKLFAYAGLMTYLIQDDVSDRLVGKFLEENRDDVWLEEWNTPGTLIIDNSRVFHGRFGENVRLKRNWIVAGE